MTHELGRRGDNRRTLQNPTIAVNTIARRSCLAAVGGAVCLSGDRLRIARPGVALGCGHAGRAGAQSLCRGGFGPGHAAVSLATLVALPVLLIVLVRRRWFCRFVCPTGLLADLVGRLRGPGAARGSKLPPIGQWLALLTLGGAAVGYPLFLWLDPLAIFAGFVHAWGRGMGSAVWLSALGLPLVLLVSLLVPGVWCARLCPLGATQDLLAWPGWKLRRRKPDESPPPAAWPLTRRVVVAGGLGAIGALQCLRWLGRSASQPLRPPGAAGGSQFTGLCVRCGSCARVCPSRILHPDLGEFGADSFLTPVVRYQDEYCLETCQRCTNVCPSGALRPLAADEKLHAAIGLPRVDMSLCLLGDDHECAICCNACPYGGDPAGVLGRNVPLDAHDRSRPLQRLRRLSSPLPDSAGQGHRDLPGGQPGSWSSPWLNVATLTK